MPLIQCCLAMAAALQLFDMSKHEVDAYLTECHRQHARLNARIEAIAERSLGTAYANGPLGEGPDGKYDQDPLIDLTRVDCVTFVEQTLALATQPSHKQAFKYLQKIRYCADTISFETRNHFMIADWLENNSFCIDVTTASASPAQTITRTISKKSYFPKVKAPELGQNTPDRSITLSYVPTPQAAEAAALLPSPSLIVFIGKIDWLFALHCGFFIRDTEGQELLYHASSKGGEVVKTGFVAYLNEQSSRYLGFTAYRFSVPAKR